MKTKNKKGFEVALRTVAVFTIGLVALATIVTFFMGGFEDVGETGVIGSAEKTREEADTSSIIEKLTGAGAGGNCEGEILDSAKECGYYYDEDYGQGSGTCPVPSCGSIGGKIVNSADSGQCGDAGGDTAAVCINSCSELTSVGNETCECVGCTWVSY